MAYCTSTQVKSIIHTTLTPDEIDEIIAESDWEIDQTIGSQTPGDLGARKLSKLLTAIQIKTRQPTSYGAGEYRETHNPTSVWQNEVARVFRLAKDSPGKIIATPYEHIDEDDRYQEDLRG